MVAVAQLVEHQIVTLGVASSTLVGYPICPVSSVGTSASLTNWMSAVRTRHRAPFYGGLSIIGTAAVLKTVHVKACGSSSLSSSAKTEAGAR